MVLRVSVLTKYGPFWHGQKWRILTFPHLNNYFNIYVCLSICSFVRPSVILCVRKLAPFPVVTSPSVTNKSYLVCVKSEKYAFGVAARPLGSIGHCRSYEAEFCFLGGLDLSKEVLQVIVRQRAAKLRSIKLWGWSHHLGIDPGPIACSVGNAKQLNIAYNFAAH